MAPGKCLVSSCGAVECRGPEKLVRAGEAVGRACPSNLRQDGNLRVEQISLRYLPEPKWSIPGRACSCFVKPMPVSQSMSVHYVLARKAGCSLRCEGGAVRLSDPNWRYWLRGTRGLFRGKQYQAEGRPDFPLQVGSFKTQSSVPWSQTSPCLFGPAIIPPGYMGQWGPHLALSRCPGPQATRIVSHVLPPSSIPSRPFWQTLMASQEKP